MVFNRIILEPRGGFSWTLDLFWVLVPLTIACGIWDLGGLETFVLYCFYAISLILGVVTILRMLGYMIVINTRKEKNSSLIKGIIWAGTMIFAWPVSWVGPVYGILIFVNYCLLEFKRLKKG